MKLVYQSSYLDIPIFNFYDSIEYIIIPLIAFYLIKSSPKGKNYIIIFAGIFLLMTSYSIYGKFKLSQKVEYAFNHKSYMVTEGMVDKLDPMPKGGHKIESFEVDGVLFKLSYTGNYPTEKTLVYTLTKNRNGPIQQNGQYVKVYYISHNGNNEIIEMWVYD